MGVCTIHLVRHAQHGLLGKVLAGRMPGVALSPEGFDQAARLAGFYRGAAIRAVLSSPVQRAHETAQPIAAGLNLPITTVDGLSEIAFGAWTGARFDDLEGQARWRVWNAARSLTTPPDGESMGEAQARVIRCLLDHSSAGGEIIAVSHSDVIKAVLAHVLGMPIDLTHRLQIAPASRSVLVIGDDFARVDAVNLPLPALP